MAQKDKKPEFTHLAFIASGEKTWFGWRALQQARKRNTVTLTSGLQRAAPKQFLQTRNVC
jgi:hypothetical protein